MAMIAIGPKPMIDKTVPTTNVPVQGAGVEYEAMAQAAGTVGKFAQDLLMRRKRAADNDFVSTQITNDMLEFSKFENDLRNTTPPDGKGYSDQVRKWQQDRFDQNMKNAPSTEARDEYGLKFRDFATRNDIQAENYMHQKAAENSANLLVDNVNKTSSMLLASPRVDRATVAKKEMDDMIQASVGVHYDQATADKFKKQAGSKIGIAVLDGLDAQENYGEAIRLLKGAGQEGDILADLDSAERGRQLKRFDNALEQKRTKNTMIASENASDFISAALNGDKLEPGLAAKRISEIQNSNMEPDKKTRLVDTIKTAALANEQAQTLVNLPPSKWQKPEDIISKSATGYNAAARERATNAIATMQTQVLKQREDDASTYVLANYPGLKVQYDALAPGDAEASQNFARNLLATQSSLEIRNTRILPKTYTTAIGTQLVGASDPDTSLAAIVGIEQQWGPYKNKVINEVITDNKLPDGYRMLPYLTSPSAKRAVLDNLRAGKPAEVVKNFAAARGSEFTEKDVTDEVAGQLSDYQSAVMYGGQNRAPLYTAMSEQVKLQAMRNMMNGDKLSDAVKKAKQFILDDSFNISEAGNGAALIPKYLPDGRTPINMENVDRYINRYSTADGLASLNLYNDQSFEEKAAQKNKSPYAFFWNEEKSTGASLYAKQIAGNVRWVPTADGDAIYPVVKDTYGGDVGLVDKAGQPVRIKFSDINAYQPPDEKTQEAIFRKNEAKANMDFFKTGR